MHDELAVAVGEGGVGDGGVVAGGDVGVDIAEEQAEGLVEAFAVGAGFFDEAPGVGAHVARVGDEQLVGFVAVADPEFVRSFRVPADAGQFRVNFDLDTVGMAGRNVRERKDRLGSI